MKSCVDLLVISKKNEVKIKVKIVVAVCLLYFGFIQYWV